MSSSVRRSEAPLIGGGEKSAALDDDEDSVPTWFSVDYSCARSAVRIFSWCRRSSLVPAQVTWNTSVAV